MNDIYAVLEHYGWDLPAPRHGWINVKCHEHDDSRASAVISQDHDGVRCMACGFGGNSIKVIMEKEGVNFARAKQVAEGLSAGSNIDVSRQRSNGARLSGQARSIRSDGRYVPPGRGSTDARSIRR
jgi:hypothetical protein